MSDAPDGESDQQTDVTVRWEYLEGRRVYFLVLPNETIEFETPNSWRNQKDAELIGHLWAEAGGFTLDPEPGMIPIEIATMGKPAIAAYLQAVHRLGRGKIATQLGVNRKTVHQYLSDLHQGRR